MTHIFRCSLLSDTQYFLIEATLQKKVSTLFLLGSYFTHKIAAKTGKCFFFKFISTFLIKASVLMFLVFFFTFFSFK